MNDAELKQLINNKREPRIGDRVRLIRKGMNHRLNGFHDGEIYTVAAPDQYVHTMDCRIVRDNGYNGYCMFDQLEVL